MVSWKHGNLEDRPYDLAIPPVLLEKVKARRFTPDGVPHTVKEIKRAGRRVYDYPFPKMELGDFFVVAVGNRSEHAMRNAFYQAAARQDFEIAIKPWKLEGGAKGLRVTVTVIGVTRYKRKLCQLLDEDALRPKGKQLFKGVPRPKFSDGKWKGRKQKWERDVRKRSGRTPKPKAEPKKAAFWADEPELPREEVVIPVERHVDPAEIRRRILAGEDLTDA